MFEKFNFSISVYVKGQLTRAKVKAFSEFPRNFNVEEPQSQKKGA
jgi:hypothetical protein